MVTVCYPLLQTVAGVTLAKHAQLAERLKASTLPEAQRRNLLGEPPLWAHYVLALGEPVRGVLPREHVVTNLGSARNIRATALRLLEIADELEPITVPHAG